MHGGRPGHPVGRRLPVYRHRQAVLLSVPAPPYHPRKLYLRQVPGGEVQPSRARTGGAHRRHQQHRRRVRDRGCARVPF